MSDIDNERNLSSTNRRQLHQHIHKHARIEHNIPNISKQSRITLGMRNAITTVQERNNNTIHETQNMVDIRHQSKRQRVSVA